MAFEPTPEDLPETPPSLPPHRCLQEDVITCLRNYSKGQTSKRMGAAPPAPKPRPLGPPPSTGGVRKPSAGQAATARRPLTVPLAALAGAGQLRPLAIRLVGAPRRKPPAPTAGVLVGRDQQAAASLGLSYEACHPAGLRAPSIVAAAHPCSATAFMWYCQWPFISRFTPADAPHSLPPSASPRASTVGKSGFGGKVAPGGRAPPGAARSAAAAAHQASPLKQRLGGSPPPRSPPSSPHCMEPLTPHGVRCDVPAPSSPTAAGPGAAAGGREMLLGNARSAFGGLRWQASMSSVGSAAAIGTYLGPATAGSAAAAASGQVLSAGAADCHLQYLTGLHSRRSRHPGTASLHGKAPPPGHATWHASAGVLQTVAADAREAEDAGSAGAALAGDLSSFGDLMQVDVEAAAGSHNKLPEEPVSWQVVGVCLQRATGLGSARSACLA